jgi:site-specific recombinase XerD
LRRRRFTRDAVSAYGVVARRFLALLERRAVVLERAQPVEVAAFIAVERRRYRRRHGRDPKDWVAWRSSLTGGTHALLRWAQGRWPPPPTNPWYERFRLHMVRTCPSPRTRSRYVFAAHRFLDLLQARRIQVEAVAPTHVDAYCRIKRAEYRRRHGRLPRDLQQWRHPTTAPIHRLLRLVHGHWPPAPPAHPLLDQFRETLLPMRYRPSSWARIEDVARDFLDHLRDSGIAPDQAQPAHVESYLQVRRRRYRERQGHDPPPFRSWSLRYAHPIHALLRVAQGGWPPPPPPPATPRERFCHGLREGFRRWMIETRGLSELTFIKDWDTAGRLLDWLGERASANGFRQLAPRDLDAFLGWRTPRLRRATRHGVCQGLRAFLRYLHGTGILERDLAVCVTSPPRYWNESIPSTFTEAQVKAMLAGAREEGTASGKRDYAILLLLATYGLRAGEITRMRLEDLDWRAERIRITQSKTGRATELPLMPPVGEAILDYLRHARPPSEHREVFLRHCAPCTPLACGSSLTSMVHRRLRSTGLPVTGKHGTHAFRYARAVSLLRASIPLQAISEVLGHRSASATDVYLKLATDDLRDVGLEVPQEVAR